MITRALTLYLGRFGFRIALANELWWFDTAHGARVFMPATLTAAKESHGWVYSIHFLWLKLALYALAKEGPDA